LPHQACHVNTTFHPNRQSLLVRPSQFVTCHRDYANHTSHSRLIARTLPSKLRTANLSQPKSTHISSSIGSYEDTLPPSYRAGIRNGTSLDISQRIEQKFAQYNASQNVFKRWLFEIVSVVTSAICMGTVHRCCPRPLLKLIIFRCDHCDTRSSERSSPP
jgi:hypothetical protein